MWAALAVRERRLIRARASIKIDCCDKNKNCILDKRLLNDGINLVESCYLEVESLSRKEKKDYLRDKINHSCIVSKSVGSTNTEKKYLKYNWNIGCGSNRMSNVCRTRFLLCYEIGHSLLEELCADVKKGLCSNAPKLSDKTSLLSKRATPLSMHMQALIDRTKQHGLNLSREQIAMMRLPNSVDAVICHGWMEFYFGLVGDSESNVDEIHLDPVPVTTIYEEYVMDMGGDKCAAPNCGIKPLSKTAFDSLWKNCFPYVKIRRFKNVSGKCKTCARLSFLRRKFRGESQRQLITKLFYLHRSAYMGERSTYAQRCQLARQSPQEYLSLATDGMQQAHCMLPYCGNLDNFSTCLPQHLQGVLVHGRQFNMFRTFHTVRNTSDSQIHTLLLTLEGIYKENGDTLPDQIFIQIDGGCENTDKNVLAICELLVIMRVTQCVLLTRLMVGHTHIDVDGFFGRLWKFIRNTFVFTAAAYFLAIVKALSTAIMICRVYDLYVVPNYHSIIRPCIDPCFGYYTKNEDTQLQFEITACQRSTNFPNGAKVRYRKFTQDKVVILKQMTGKSVLDFEAIDTDNANSIAEDEEDLNITLDNVHVSWQPAAKYDKAGEMIEPEGMYVIKTLPTASSIQPKGLLHGSRKCFEHVMSNVRRYFHSNPAVIKEWEDWDKAYLPQNDDVVEYLKTHPDKMVIPFEHILFGGMLPDLSTYVVPDIRSKKKQLGQSLKAREVNATDSVSWSERGNKTKLKRDKEPYETITSDKQHVYTLTDPTSSQPKQKQTATKTSNKSCKKKRKCENTDSSSDSEFDDVKNNASSVVVIESQSAMVSLRNRIQNNSKQLKTSSTSNSNHLKSLGPEDANRVNAIFNGAEEDDMNVVADKFGITMYQVNLKCLRNSYTMINDEVVNFALKMINQRDTNTKCFFNYYFFSYFYEKLTFEGVQGLVSYGYNYTNVKK